MKMETMRGTETEDGCAEDWGQTSTVVLCKIQGGEGVTRGTTVGLSSFVQPSPHPEQFLSEAEGAEVYQGGLRAVHMHKQAHLRRVCVKHPFLSNLPVLPGVWTAMRSSAVFFDVMRDALQCKIFVTAESY
jgi:hypothetical protein